MAETQIAPCGDPLHLGTAFMNAPPSPSNKLEKTLVSAVSELKVEGMTCNNCARHVTEAIQSVPGVRHASVTLDANRASVRWQPGVAENIPAVLNAIKAAGYEAKAKLHAPSTNRRSDNAAIGI